MKYLIIGNSASGIGAAEAIREVDEKSEIVMITDEMKTIYSRPLLSYLFDGTILKKDLYYRPDEFYEKKKVDIIYNKKVNKIFPEDSFVLVESGEKIFYNKLLIAAGAIPKIPNIPGIDKEGVFSFRNLNDLERILSKIKTAEKAFVLGGGNIGLQAACGLKSYGIDTTVVVSSSYLLSQLADETAGEIYKDLFEKNGISIKTNSNVTEISGDKRVEKVKFKDGTTEDCQILIIGKGVNPNIEFLKSTNIKCRQGIEVDEYMRTNINDIYAAGDITETVDIVTGKKTINAVWPCAYEQGRIAGFNMTGLMKKYQGSIRMNAAEFFGLPFISIGIVKIKEEDYEIISNLDKEKNIYKKLVTKNNIIIGLLFVKDIDKAGLYHNLIKKKIDISPVKSILLKDNFNAGVLISLIKKDKDLLTEDVLSDII